MTTKAVKNNWHDFTAALVEHRCPTCRGDLTNHAGWAECSGCGWRWQTWCASLEDDRFGTRGKACA